jgi:hypothetical protein
MAAKRHEELKTFTWKLSAEERDLLRRLVQARAAELHEATGQQLEVSIASYLRWLVEQDAKKRGLLKPPAAPARRK